MTLQEMQRQLALDRCCGGPVINRKPVLIHKKPLTALERMEQEQAEARELWNELRSTGDSR